MPARVCHGQTPDARHVGSTGRVRRAVTLHVGGVTCPGSVGVAGGVEAPLHTACEHERDSIREGG